mgnify:CR=1 FL=1
MLEMLSVIGNLGFPIAISAYLLIRLEGKLVELTSVIRDLRETIITLPSSPAWNFVLHNLSSVYSDEVSSASRQKS